MLKEAQIEAIFVRYRGGYSLNINILRNRRIARTLECADEFRYFPNMSIRMAIGSSARALIPRWMGCCAACFCASITGSAQDYGQEKLDAIGPYLNGALPEAEIRPDGAWSLESAFSQLDFADPDDNAFVFEPIALTHEPRGDRLFASDKKGKIWAFANLPDIATKSLFLDISDRIKITPNAGLGELAFHPEFGRQGSTNYRFVYTHYFWSPDPNELGNVNQVRDSADELPNPGYWRLSRFTASKDGTTVDPESELILIQQFDAHHWHNGGSLFFGNDGFLYLSSGDIGGDQNFYDAAQTLERGLFGGVLRIDVDKDETRSHPPRRQPTNHDVHGLKPADWPDSYSQEYFIPEDNPWLDENGTLLEEFWAIGIRSPHRMSYDRETEEIWVGDVGQSRVEEVSQVIRGGNSQWPYFDGLLGGYRPKPDPLLGDDFVPAHTYAHSANGAAVIGGPVYRGHAHRASLEGKVLFADHQTGVVSSLSMSQQAGVQVEQLLQLSGSGFHTGISAFGTDRDGEVYVCRLNRDADGNATPGEILKFARASAAGTEPPALLSQTGAFSNLQNLTPSPGLIPFAPAAPFWSDGAEKYRWIAIPNNGVADTDKERISFSPDGNWEFPIGTVLVKHFDMPVDARNPQLTKRIETRFLVRGADGEFFGLAYRWREDQMEANLVQGRKTFAMPQIDDAGAESQLQWTIPSRAECMQCHTFTSGGPLGVRTHQLNSDFHYPLTDRTDNQLRVLAHLGVLSPAPDETELGNLPKAVNPRDETAPLTDRARSYIDTNCASCHRPQGVYANFDARLTTPLKEQHLINGLLVGGYGIEGEGVIRPRESDRSIFLHRLASLGADRMPPIGKSTIDERGVRLINEWIESLNPSDWDGNIYDAPATWLRKTFGEEADPAITAWDADPDGDKMTNLLEFALGTHGLRPEGAPLKVDRTTEHALLKLASPIPQEITIAVEVSLDAKTWSIAQDVGFELNETTLKVPLSVDQHMMWFRLRVSFAPEE